MIDFKSQYNDRINIIDDYMKKCLDENFKCESELFEAMEYAVFGSGKRLRSVLCIETAKMLTGKKTGIAGPIFFKYKGKNLQEYYNEFQVKHE